MSKALAVLWMIVVAALTLCTAAWCEQTTESAAKPPASEAALYDPFSEPRPKIPQEIIDDKRLDQKVKVFVKSKNMKQLFTDLSEKTGVKITAGRDVQGERPIIYFHKRPLREVMTEISGHYGYRWLIGGKEGSYQYELFEDTWHVKRREDAIKAIQRAQNRLLLEFTKKCIDDETFLDRATQVKSPATNMLTAGYAKGFTKLLSRCGMEFLSDMLEKEGGTYRLGDLPAEMQPAFTDWLAAANQARAEAAKAMQQVTGRDYSPPVFSASGIQSATLRFKRVTQGLLGMPMIQLEMDTPGSGTLIMQWPSFNIGEDAVRNLLGKSDPHTSSKPLPSEPKITCTKKRSSKYDKFLILGDVLEAIALKSDLDLIADYHYRDGMMATFTDTPLDKVVQLLCRAEDYTYRAQDGIIRLRPVKWYVEGPPMEPPAEMLAKCWKEVETDGGVSLRSILDMALLPDDQMRWPGFLQIRGAEIARNRPSTLRLWASLIDSQEIAARTKDGLPVSKLMDDQMRKLTTWMNAMGVVPSPEELSKAVIRINVGGMEDGGTGKTSGSSYAQFSLDMADNRKYPIAFPISCLSPERAKLLMDERKADAEADVIELVQ